jgi:hypothetical protein
MSNLWEATQYQAEPKRIRVPYQGGFMKRETKVSRKISAGRALAGVKISEVAAALGLSRFSIWRRLSGRLPWRPGELERVADLLGVSPEWLTEGDDD